ncbi:MAG: biotin--[acetyl-CoA-carboxylase] ligase, partial [Bacteroidaceae bacterium]|nr:biotin--[acetyl-CoA-carboxylase] ligase [Bacteroidaceae bacterium]
MNRERHFCLDESPHFHMMELDTIDSTNNFLKKYRPPRPCRMTLATAEFQTNGRGADTNSWESAYG